jgi:ribonuclease H2 subunit A
MTTTARVGDSNDWSLDWPKMRVPDSCRGVDVVVGVDEAGRGPVLGSLVYCAAFWPVSEHEQICKMGFDDSKQLKEGERDKFLRDILNHPSIGYVVRDITARDIAEVSTSRQSCLCG